MSDPTFTTHGDDALEARITAWVLGEASDFEAAELERLCGQRPELLVFKRRIEALHGLLGEAEVSGPDADWKLRPAKRRPIESILMGDHDREIEERIRRSSWRAFAGIAACVVLTLAVAALLGNAIILKDSSTSEAGEVVLYEAKVAANIERRLDKAEKMVPFSSVAGAVPNELIEGTPMPINEPGLVDPSLKIRAMLSANEELEAQPLAAPIEEAPVATSRPVRKSNSGAKEWQRGLSVDADSMSDAADSSLVLGDAESGATGQLSTFDGSESLTRERSYFRASSSPQPAFRHGLADNNVSVVEGGVRAESLGRNVQELADDAVTMSTLADGSSYSGGYAMADSLPGSRGEAVNEDAVAGAQWRGVQIDGGVFAGKAELVPSAGTVSLSGQVGSFADSPARPQPEIESIREYAYQDSYPDANGDRRFGGDAGAMNRLSMRRDAIAADEARVRANAPLADRELTGRQLEQQANNRAAHDQSSAELLMKVDEAWELDSPKDAAQPAKPQAPAGPEIAAIQQQIGEQEAKLEERRKVLASLVRTKGIIYKGDDSYYGKAGVDENMGARDAQQAYHQVEQEKLQLESQIRSLENYDDDQLMTYASGLKLPDNAVSELYPKKLELKRQIEEQRLSGLSDSHPKVKQAQQQLAVVDEELNESVTNLRATLTAQHDLASERLSKIERMKNLSREESIKRGLDAQDYVDAKREFEAEQELLMKLKLEQKLMEARMGLNIEEQEKAQQPEAKLEWTRPVPIEGEMAAVQEPYSTFSLNINDASFRMAQAALAKGEMPDPNGIQVEQFYNAVDYGDPSPASGEPVAGFVEQSAHPVIPGRNLVRIAIKTAAAGRAPQQPLHLTLLTDLSGSMAREDRRAAMEEALAGLSELLQPQDVINVIGFSRTPRLLAEGLRGNQAGKLAEFMNLDANEGGTNLEEALKLAEQLAMRHKAAGAQNRIVLFTDGAANLGDADPASLAERIKELRQNGLALDIAGIAADGLNDELLGEMARNGNGRYYVVGKGEKIQLAKQLAGAFRPAAENVKVQVHFNPERVGGYKLIGFEKDLLNKEDFRNDKVDAAEMAAEEAGVAIYQVETLPEGSGEIGEVSVRFRDVASGQMVERAWAITHDPVAPGIADAPPSMQLAALAMMAGQKLKGGPMAAAIDLGRYAGVQASVRQYYGDDKRVGELLQMIDTLK